ncbi:MAG: hypothetical protein CML46_05380 [Rhodobacteraceae bacterium]|nr:hypothetical protein [Paracoccaceae bacterium]MBR25691.1 hypothetical protein [Paracoccaceae bacterium]MBR26360.1 hypothetical protein [Paracoccaceae bacterium]
MWRRFTSSFFNKVDAKGRVSVPAAWRKTLEARGADGNLILVPGFRDRRCIEGYAPDTYETLAAAISSMHPSDPKRRKLEYRLMGRAVPLQVDENGRIVIGADLRNAFGLEPEAVFVGMGEGFQLWSRAAYDLHVAPVMDDDEDDGDPLAAMPWPGSNGGPGGMLQ